MEDLKICFTSPSPNAYSETFIQNIKNGLEGKVFHCYGGFFPHLTLNGKLQNFKTPPLKDMLLNRFNLINQPLQEFYFIRFLKNNKIDVIFANYGPSGAALAPIAKKLNIPLIVHFHGFDASIYSVLEEFKTGYELMFEIAKKVIVVSEEMKNDLLRIGAPKNKLVRITYAPHPRFLKLKPKYSGNQLLSVSRFVEKKAPYLTILAYKLAKDQCPDLTLKMVGDGDLLPVCKDICRYMNLDGIEFLGVKSPEEIEFEMENSFCFLQHSKMAENGDKEGTPVSILEAMAAGLPVISTKHAGIPDLVKDGNSGFLVEEGDVKLMAEKIVLLQRNKKTSHDFGQNSRKEILKNYIFSEYLERINKIIFSVV